MHDERLKGLSLFSGIGGLELGLSQWVRPIAYCEADPYAQGVLLSRMRDGSIAEGPIAGDVRSLRGDYFLTKPDIIFGGFPCTQISAANPTGEGLAGIDSGLYWEIYRLVTELEPTLVFLENVPRIRTRGLNEVVRSLSDLGLVCRWTTVSAAELGACHLRERWFLLAANTKRLNLWLESGRWNGEGRQEEALTRHDGEIGNSPWSPTRISKPSVDRSGDGIPYRVDRNKALGNSCAPQQAKTAFERLIGITSLHG